METLTPTPTEPMQPSTVAAAVPPPPRTALSALDVAAPLRTKLENAGVRDVEGVLELPPTKLTEIVGDAAAASTLTESARTVIGGGTTRGGADKTPRKKAAPKRRK